MSKTTTSAQRSRDSVPIDISKRFLSSAAFAKKRYQTDWLVEMLLVPRQPTVIGGPKKSLKTSLVVDMALSLGTGTPFLSHFLVPSSKRVAILSGESGEATLQRMAQRVCAAKRVALKTCAVWWSSYLPRFCEKRRYQELGDYLRDEGIEVAFVDPLYLCLFGGIDAASASNLYAVGPLLHRVTRILLRRNITPIFVHHTTKTKTRSRAAEEPLDLDDLAFAGIGEFARQWLLVSRRCAFQPGSGLHQLLLSAGGSAGQSGCWAVTIKEGQLRRDFSGQGWDVQVTDQVSAPAPRPPRKGSGLSRETVG